MQHVRACYAYRLSRTACQLLGAVQKGQTRSWSSQIGFQNQLLPLQRKQKRQSCLVEVGMSTTSQIVPKFSLGSDETVLSPKLRGLLPPVSSGSQADDAGSGGRWTLIPNGEGLERNFKFKTFAKTWDFMTAVSLQCKLKNHHPEWSNVYNTAFIRWTTHSPPGLSAQDVELACVCDGLAKDFGEIIDDTTHVVSCSVGKQLVDTVASSAGDCCVPKLKTK